MRDDFCAFILSHGRPDKIYTLNLLKKSGYTGKCFIVIDDEDTTRERYQELFGDKVLVFSKSDIASRFDEAELDDDYTAFQFRVGKELEKDYCLITRLDPVLEAMIEYYEAIPAKTIAMAQGGDFLGDSDNASWLKRKAMNSLICSTDRPFEFIGRINEDVNTYTTLGRRGELFLTIGAVQLLQKPTQSNSGGMTELYLASGTYVKSFYSVMYAPSCVKISMMGLAHQRIHHRISWNNTAVKILDEKYKKRLPVSRG